jgi:hypothetical protein
VPEKLPRSSPKSAVFFSGFLQSFWLSPSLGPTPRATEQISLHQKNVLALVLLLSLLNSITYEDRISVVGEEGRRLGEDLRRRKWVKWSCCVTRPDTARHRTVLSLIWRSDATFDGDESQFLNKREEDAYQN